MVSYIIVFAIIIIGVIIWQLRSNTRYLRLSHQEYPELTLDILVSKKERKIDEFIIRIYAKKDIILRDISIELISVKREFGHITITEVLPTIILPFNIDCLKTADTLCSYEDLKKIINDRMNELSTFRVVLRLQNNKVCKSHELKFDNLWKIYKADTGKYN